MSDKRSAAPLDPQIDQLYQAPLDQFTAARNALAAELRKAGDRDAADRVKALPKPTLTAWALNQAWWRDRPRFKALFDADARLRAAYLDRDADPKVDVRKLAEVRQEAVSAVVEAAVDTLDAPHSSIADLRHRLAGTVEALATGGDDPPPGRWVKDRQATGLELLGALAGAVAERPARPPRPVIVSRREAPASKAEGPDKPGGKRAEREARAEAARHAELETARRRLQVREQALREAQKEAADAAKAEGKAKQTLEAAVAEVARLEGALDDAREHERQSRKAHTEATRLASQAELNRARTARDVESARQRVDDLTDGD